MSTPGEGGASALTFEQRQQLAADYLPLARRLAQQFQRRWPHSEADEFESAACLALVKASRAFDPSRGLAFSTLAHRVVTSALIDHERVLRRRREANDIGWLETVAGRAESQPVEFEDLIRFANAQDRELLRLRYRDSYTFAEIAERFGLKNRTHAFLAHARVLARLRESLPCLTALK